MKFSIVIISVLWCLVTPVYPWDSEGQRAVAQAAREMLTPEAKAKIVRILGNDDLAAVSTWLDDVTLANKHHSGPLKEDPEAREFNARFPQNDEWHYVNFPVGIKDFYEAGLFISVNNIQVAIEHATFVLEGRRSDMTDQQALKVLVNLVADAHQPLDCAAGYYDLSDPMHPKLLEVPRVYPLGEKIIGSEHAIMDLSRKPHDRGGKKLFYSRLLQLHAFWDSVLVKDLIRAEPEASLAQQLIREAKQDDWSTKHHELSPMVWVEDSAIQAIEVYRGIAFGKASLNPDGSIDRIEITLPEKFEENQMKIAKIQMAKAAFHLAEFLNALEFK